MRIITTYNHLPPSVRVFVAGCLAVSALAHPLLWPFAIVSLLLFLRLIESVTSWRSSLRVGWVYGFTISGGSIVWVFEAFPLTRMGVSDPILSAIIIAFVWTLTSFVLGAATAIVAVLYRHLRQSTRYDILLFASLWILSEILRSLLFATLSLAPSSLYGAHWTFGYIGYALAGSPALLQLGSIGGVYVLSALCACAAAIGVRMRWSEKRLVAIVMLCILLSFSLPHAHTTENTLHIAVLKTSEHSSFTTNKQVQAEAFERLNALIAAVALKAGALDAILIPEDARYTHLHTAAELDTLGLPPTTTIVDSSRFEQASGLALSRVTTYSAREGKTVQYTKVLLAPEGEYMSRMYQYILRGVGLGDIVDRFTKVKAYDKGTAHTPSMVGGVPLAISLCSEIYSPLIQRDMAYNAGLIVDLASHSTFKGSSLLEQYILAISKVRAVENNRYVVQATNYAESFIISNRGQLVARTSPENPFDVLVGDVPLVYARTPFSYAPYAVPLLSLVVVLWVALLRRNARAV